MDRCTEAVRGLPAIFWQVYVARWRDRAFICRYACQDIYRLLGRDPVKRPLTALEQALFLKCTEEHVIAERKPFVEMGVPPP